MSNVNKSNVGVETPTYIKNFDVRIWKKSVNNFSCHPEIAASLVADENEAYKRGCSQSISGSSHRQKCSTICTQKANVGLKAQPAYGYSDEPYRAEHNMDVPQHNPTTCKKKNCCVTESAAFTRENLVPAFTLAEVLVTLGIIGVIAALTMPMLIDKYEKLVTIAKLKRAYSMVSQVVNRAVAANGDVKDWDSFFDENDICESYFTKYWKPYIKIGKYPVRFDRMAGGEEEKWKHFGYTGPFSPMTGCPWYSSSGTLVCSLTVGFTFLTTDNMLIHVDMNNRIVVDLNGSSLPNRMGHDVFWFSINSKTNKVGPREDTNGYGCSKKDNPGGWGTGYSCADKIIKDGWQIKDDYPW